MEELASNSRLIHLSFEWKIEIDFISMIFSFNQNSFFFSIQIGRLWTRRLISIHTIYSRRRANSHQTSLIIRLLNASHKKNEKFDCLLCITYGEADVASWRCRAAQSNCCSSTGFVFDAVFDILPHTDNFIVYMNYFHPVSLIEDWHYIEKCAVCIMWKFIKISVFKSWWNFK